MSPRPGRLVHVPVARLAQKMSIEEFVYDTVRKQYDFKMYRFMRSSGIDLFVIRWLKKMEFEFEDIQVNRDLFAFSGDQITGEGMVRTT